MEEIGTIYRLTANKTKMYNLCKLYLPPPPMKETDFKKATGCRSFWLEYGSFESIYLYACCGIPRLIITNSHTEDPQTITLELEELHKMVMIEEKD